MKQKLHGLDGKICFRERESEETIARRSGSIRCNVTFLFPSKYTEFFKPLILSKPSRPRISGYFVARIYLCFLPHAPIRTMQNNASNRWPQDQRTNACIHMTKPILNRPRRFIHMPTLTQHSPKPLMHLCLKGRKRDSLPIDTDVAIWLVLGDDPIA